MGYRSFHDRNEFVRVKADRFHFSYGIYVISSRESKTVKFFHNKSYLAGYLSLHYDYRKVQNISLFLWGLTTSGSQKLMDDTLRKMDTVISKPVLTAQLNMLSVPRPLYTHKANCHWGAMVLGHVRRPPAYTRAAVFGAPCFLRWDTTMLPLYLSADTAVYKITHLCLAPLYHFIFHLGLAPNKHLLIINQGS